MCSSDDNQLRNLRQRVPALSNPQTFHGDLGTGQYDSAQRHRQLTGRTRAGQHGRGRPRYGQHDQRPAVRSRPAFLGNRGDVSACRHHPRFSFSAPGGRGRGGRDDVDTVSAAQQPDRRSIGDAHGSGHHSDRFSRRRRASHGCAAAAEARASASAAPAAPPAPVAARAAEDTARPTAIARRRRSSALRSRSRSHAPAAGRTVARRTVRAPTSRWKEWESGRRERGETVHGRTERTWRYHLS